MPRYGILPVTVPGSAWGWDEVLRRFGKKSFKEVLQPAIDYAENGFPISERIANDWRLPECAAAAEVLHRAGSGFDQDLVYRRQAPGRRTDLPQSRSREDLPAPAEGRRDAFYKGEIARAIVAKSKALGGTMTWRISPTTRASGSRPRPPIYHGYDVLELPPPSQAWAANEMLNILEACVPKWAPGQTLATLGPRSPKYWHLVVEAKKLAYRDLYTLQRRSEFREGAARPAALEGIRRVAVRPGRSRQGLADRTARRTDLAAGDTIVLSTADSEGNMVSWVNSNFAGFGSGLTVPGYGFILHNRGGAVHARPQQPERDRAAQAAVQHARRPAS